jgi:predicted amidohydrolase
MSNEARAAIRIAAAQYPIERFTSLGAYRDKLARWVREASADGAELLVFPEYGAMEYAGAAGEPSTALAASLQAVSDALGEMDATHADLARRHNVHILAASGPLDIGEGRFVNASRIFAPSGAHARQDKTMMTPFEREWGILAGDSLNVFDTALARIGVAICYDSEFPLLVRTLREAGAELILIPSCTEFVSGANRIRTAALARALENGCACVTAPTVGDAPWSPAVDRNTGSAGIFVPAEHGLSETGVVAEGTLNRPGWVHGVVDLARLSRVRQSGEMRNDSDWLAQPGATALQGRARIVPLR